MPGRQSRSLASTPAGLMALAVTLFVALALVSCSEGSSQARAAGPRKTRGSSTTTSSEPPPSSSTTASSTTSTTMPAASAPRAGGQAVVVIDPGHNGNNWRHTAEINRQVDAGGFKKACNTTGTSGGDLTEAAFTLAVARRLEALLAADGIKVILTRSDNDGWGPCVDERGQIAQRANADLMVSIHADGSGAQDRGFHVIHPSPIKGYTDTTAAQSERAATLVRDALIQAGLQPSTYVGTRGLIRRGDLGTLNRAGVPAIMIESGNMKNAADLALLSSEDGQQRLARGIAAGVTQYLAARG